MPLYRNIKTGAVVDVSCELAGGWELVNSKKEKPVAKTEKVEEPKKAETKKKAK